MTTITEQPPALPEWEHTLRHDGYLPAVDDESARDIDYLITRLRDARNHASGIAAEYRDLRDGVGDRIELSLLRDDIDKLLGELRPYRRGGDEMFAILRQAHPALRWARTIGGFLGWPKLDQEDGAAERSARQLRLLAREPVNGIRVWRGIIETWSVQVSER
jgi:hypothetical protein